MQHVLNVVIKGDLVVDGHADSVQLSKDVCTVCRFCSVCVCVCVRMCGGVCALDREVMMPRRVVSLS